MGVLLVIQQPGHIAANLSFKMDNAMNYLFYRLQQLNYFDKPRLAVSPSVYL